ncbi:MAG: 50S ribosomal protein L7/L12 [Candidatus Cloacimonetes bacterium]|nr:50S ribosomal protein L7/L12 [Candidatus Cloacimonadota bacterium]
MSDKSQQIIEMVEKLTVLELSDLVKALEEKFGVTAAAPMAVAAGPAVAAAAPAEEKTEFNVVLVNDGGKKIQVIKVVRELNSSLGLKEAKDLVDTAPKPVLENVDKAVAEDAKKKLEEAGATVELK